MRSFGSWKMTVSTSSRELCLSRGQLTPGAGFTQNFPTAANALHTGVLRPRDPSWSEGGRAGCSESETAAPDAPGPPGTPRPPSPPSFLGLAFGLPPRGPPASGWRAGERTHLSSSGASGDLNPPNQRHALGITLQRQQHRAPSTSLPKESRLPGARGWPPLRANASPH